MENNFEFRIWDTELKRWRKMTERPDKCFRRIFICPDGLIVEIHDVQGDTMFYANNTQGRFELSQSIGRKDSKGVRAFTGDMLKSSVYDRDHCEIVFRDGVYCVSVNNEEWHPIHDHFTVIGNKWEGIFPVKDFGPEARTQSSIGGDSTVQQEGDDTGSYEEIPPMPKSNLSFQYDKEGTLITEEYLQILAERRFPDAGGHSSSILKQRIVFAEGLKSGLSLLPEAFITLHAPQAEGHTIIIEEFAKEMRDTQEEIRGKMQQIRHSEFHETIRRQLAGSANLVSLKDMVAHMNKDEPKNKRQHDEDRAHDLLSAILRAKHRNEPTGIGWVTELTELITYKVDTRKA